jgi:hypothetical protein
MIGYVRLQEARLLLNLSIVSKIFSKLFGKTPIKKPGSKTKLNLAIDIYNSFCFAF